MKYDILCRRLRYSSGDLSVLGPVGFVADRPGIDERDPCVAFLGPNSVVAWSEELNTTTEFNYNIRAVTVDADDCVRCGTVQTMTGNIPVYDYAPEVVALRSTGENSDIGMIVFSEAEPAPAFGGGEIEAQRFEGIGTGGAVSVLGGGCGIASTISRSGPAAAGNTSFAINLVAPGTLATTLVFDLDPVVNPLIPCGTCAVLTGIATQLPDSFVPATGSASATLPIPCNAGLIGARLQAQWLMLAPGPAPCPIVADISASDRLRVTIGQ
jgi:hypothetical protein